MDFCQEYTGNDDIATIVSSNISAKNIEDFRNYDNVLNKRHEIVEKHYKMMRTNQTFSFVEMMLEKYNFEYPRATMSIFEAFKVLQNYVDSSDPDVSLPNMVHMLQTAEGIRKKGHPDWFQLVGLIHDMGKIMFLWGDESIGQNGTADGAQWSLGGDTWVVGCRIPDCTVFPHFNQLNPDQREDSLYSTEYGIYSPKCGLKNVKFAYGHDEYMYQMLLANKSTIPPEGLAMIRYHSCYPWHTGHAYRHLMDDSDYEALKWVLEFNKFDLYTKDDDAQWLQTAVSDERHDMSIRSLWPYYQSLIDKYFPTDTLKW